MIDLNSENPILLRDVPAWCEENLNNRVHISTVHRWRIRGARGVRLETFLAAGTRYTSHEALQRFFARCTAAADGECQILCTGVMDEADISRAEQFLQDEGI